MYCIIFNFLAANKSLNEFISLIIYVECLPLMQVFKDIIS